MLLITLFYTKCNYYCFETTPENVSSYWGPCSISTHFLLGLQLPEFELLCVIRNWIQTWAQSMEVSEINFIDLLTKSKRIHTIALLLWCQFSVLNSHIENSQCQVWFVISWGAFSWWYTYVLNKPSRCQMHENVLQWCFFLNCWLNAVHPCAINIHK